MRESEGLAEGLEELEAARHVHVWSSARTQRFRQMARNDRYQGGYRTAMGYGESPTGRHRLWRDRPERRRGNYPRGYSGGSQRFGGVSYGGHGSTGDYSYGARGEYGESQFGGGFEGTTDRFGNPRPREQSPQDYWRHNFGWMGYGAAPYHGVESDELHAPQGRERPQPTFRRGPKGYRRSDQRLLEEICETIREASHIDASDVSVSVHDGEVTLEGIVPVRQMKHAIEDIADTCPGVHDIDNRIRVQR